MFDNEQVDIDKVMDSFDSFMGKRTTGMVFDYIMETDNPTWEDFHKKNPKVCRCEYEQGLKEFQEV